MQVDSSYPSQSRFSVEVFSPATLSWNELWRLDPCDFYAQTAGPPQEAGLDPSSPLITTARHDDLDRIAQSWQKVVDALHARAEEILSKL